MLVVSFKPLTTYQGEGAEEVGIVESLPLLDVGMLEACNGRKDAVVDDNAIELPKRLDRNVCNSGSHL